MRLWAAVLSAGVCAGVLAPAVDAATARFELDPAQSMAVMNRRILQSSAAVPIPVRGRVVVDTATVGAAAVSGIELDFDATGTTLVAAPFSLVNVAMSAGTLRSVGAASLAATPGPGSGQLTLGDGTIAADVTGTAWHSGTGAACVTLEAGLVPCIFSMNFAVGGARPVTLMSGVVSGPPGSRTLQMQVGLRVVLPGIGTPWGEHLVVASIRASEVATAPTCRADFNLSGAVEVGDIFAFLSAWFGNDPRADISGDGARTVADIFAFLTLWFARC